MAPSTESPVRSGDPSKIEHVVYIIKENRTYDQVFGDIARGNGDPTLVMFGEKVIARWTQGAPGTVQVTLSPASFGVPGRSRPSGGPGVDRLSDELSGLLPAAG